MPLIEIEIEVEQWADLHWATNVIDGYGDKGDDLSLAELMVKHIAASGANAAVRKAAQAIASMPEQSGPTQKNPPKVVGTAAGKGGGV